MRDWMGEVRALWEAYIAETERLERDKKPGAGIFGLTPGPKDDPCHERFGEDAERLLADMRAAEPASGAVREVLEYIYRVPAEHWKPLTAYWMLQAVHGLTVPLTELLTAEEAAALRDEYARTYKRRDRFPAQKKLLTALEKAAKG